MKKTVVPLKQCLVVLQIALWACCAVHSIHNEAFVSDALSERTGHKLRVEWEEGAVRFPDDIVMEDGLTEDEAVAIALWNNAQFQADLVRLGFARADLVEAGMLRNPIFSLLFPLGPKQLEATLNLPVEFFWQRPKRVEAAKLNAEQVADSLIQHGLDLVRDVLMAYAELERSRDLADIAGQDAASGREIAVIAAERLRVGDISGLEETALQLEAARTEEASARAARDAELAEERLRNLLGLGFENIGIELRPDPDSWEHNRPVPDLLQSALAARPDLRAAELAIEAAGQRIGWERSKVFDFTAMIDANGEGKEGFEMGPGLQLAIPVLNQNNGKVKRAQAELTRAARQYIAVRHRIAREVGEAHTRYTAARRALKILQEEVVPAAETAAANAAEAYEIGEISYLELLDFKRQLLMSRLRETEARADARKAQVSLEHSIGFKPDSD